VATAGEPVAFEFVDLTGETPPALGLPSLASIANGVEPLRRAFGSLSPDAPDRSPCVVLYAAGHAWVEHGGPATSLRLADGSSKVLTGEELWAIMEHQAKGRNALVVLDVCHAGAFEDAVKSGWKPWAVVFASGRDQAASAFPIDKATRLMTALGRSLATKKPIVELDNVLDQVILELGRADVIKPQSVEVFRFGPRLRFARRDRIVKTWGDLTTSTIRATLFGVGAVLAVALIFGGWFYVTHAWIEVDIGDLATKAHNVQVVVTKEEPRDNLSTEVSRDPVEGHVLRIRVPAADITVHVTAAYPDGQPRAVNFPLLLSSGVDWNAKLRSLSLPDANQVLAHPGMAYVPRENWVETPGQPARISKKAFWIDIYPLTVRDYEPLLRKFLTDGSLRREQSVLAKLVSDEDLDKVGAGKIGELAKGLAPILNIVNGAASEHPIEQLPVAPGFARKPCDKCSAPVSYDEAVLYCGSRHARVPEFEELELAGRGVDGRRFPWGDRFDKARANAPGLPDKGDPPPAMRPVDSYPAGKSPFGVMGIAGDSGKWVARDDDSYPSYIGASFRQSGDEVQPFAHSLCRRDEHPGDFCALCERLKLAHWV
jgi:hypothetical protein